ncbi:MAG: serine/threonine protein kinase [Myxococcales bacterium]|nr:serine/threonine protein kinase [Myxococcales bacterium]
MTTEYADLVGHVFGSTYTIDRILGQGGMGAVFSATNMRIGKRVAIKVLSSLIRDNAEAVQRFRREARIATELGHPHIVDVVDFNETHDGVPYIVMEFLSGRDLADVLAVPMPAERLVPIVRQVCWALDAAHQRGIVHRDLKPANIFLCSDREYADFVKVVDFGISKVLGSVSIQTQEAAILGTPHYMAPEQADPAAGSVTARTDVYAIGAILYRALSGRLPIEGETLATMLYQIVHTEPKPLAARSPELSPSLCAVVHRALAKRPGERFASVRELSLALLDAVPDAPKLGRDWEREASASADALAATLPPASQTPIPPTQVSSNKLASTTLSSAASELSVAPEPPVRRRAVALVVAALLIVAAGIAGVTVYVRGRGGEPARRGATAAKGAAANAANAANDADAATSKLAATTPSAPDKRHTLTDGPQTTADAAAAVAATVIKVAISGTRGALVFEQQTRKKLGALPLSLELDAKRLPLRIVVRRRGYWPAVRTITRERSTLTVTLVKRARKRGDLPGNPN